MLLHEYVDGRDAGLSPGSPTSSGRLYGEGGVILWDVATGLDPAAGFERRQDVGAGR
ncbi:hypothetical protein ABT061_13295 [Streptosporangium sp. NPDC002544]|uniref:hypothetical protein n=1 Tax=Streptosporangium sp. NPDC002544 TaxID=3154538 RepID=UPI00331B47FA